MEMLSICFNSIKLSEIIENYGLKPQKRIKNFGDELSNILLCELLKNICVIYKKKKINEFSNKKSNNI